MKINRHREPWKCRAVENGENQTQVSPRFPPPLEIATAIPTFPQRRPLSFFSSDRTRKTTQRSPKLRPSRLQPFRLIHRLENATLGLLSKMRDEVIDD